MRDLYTFKYGKCRVDVYESGGRLERCVNGGAYDHVTRTQLARDYPNAHGLWEWLKGRGLSKPHSGTSGPSLTRAEREERGERQIAAWVPNAGIDALDALMSIWGLKRGPAIGKACEIALEIEKKRNPA